MPSIVVAPHLEVSRVLVPGVVTVPAEMATIGCSPGCSHDELCINPARVADIPYTMHGLELFLLESGHTMVERLNVRGYDWLGELRFHGPFYSREFNTRLTDLARSEWAQTKPYNNRDGERHPEHSLGFVADVDAWSPYMDYVLIGAFLKRNALMED